VAGYLIINSGMLWAANEDSFNEKIRPILTEHCLHCHGPDERSREADLRLDLEDQAKLQAIVPGFPDLSPLVERITTNDPDLQMPPPGAKKPLNPDQIASLRSWIETGAAYQGHWAFEPIRQPTPPAISLPSATHATKPTDIDHFILEQLSSRTLGLSPAVSRYSLIRRVTLDLTGLPPTWEEVQAFVQDESPDAYSRLLDRLLDSPSYGERWGRHWLDLARYADTHGGSAIGYTRFPFSYTYRDYVIDAFNADLAYDRFVMEQLAADQMGLEAHDPALAALGFLTVGMQFRNPHDVIDDQIDVVTRGLMGLTVACARCHDHKYDPVPTRDYYSLYSIFASSKTPELFPIIGQPSRALNFQEYQTELTRRQGVYRDMARDQTEVMRGRLRMQVGLYLRELARGTPEQDVAAAFLSYRTDDIRPTVLNRWRDYLENMPANDPVFGPWVQLSQVKPPEFHAKWLEMLEQFKSENGDPEKFDDMRLLRSQAPRWNPRVLEALETQKPTSLLMVADAYGGLFADVHRRWLDSLLQASLEAANDAEIVTDEDARHKSINSAIERQLRRHLYDRNSPTALPDEIAITLLNRPVHDTTNGLSQAIENLHLTSPASPPRAMVLAEQIPAQSFHIFRRGNPIDRGEVVEPHFLTAISRKGNEEIPIFTPGHLRWQLAQAIVDRDNPLLRRVIVNWVWQHHFGQGLASAPDDFGMRSEAPSHPQLLDYLAEKLLEDDWSLKKLHKRILLSQVYQQAAIENSAAREIDPENRWLWRMPRRRLDMEAMRDSLLAVSGELDLNNPGGRPYELESEPIVPRRTVYGFVNRDIISSLASTFDRADPSSCTVRRSETIVPQQTLFALNSTFIQDRAAEFAKLSDKLAYDEDSRMEERVRFMYRRAYAREPDSIELHTAITFIDNRINGETHEQRWQLLAHALLASNEFVFVD
jgi:PAS domain-containing protein